MLDKFPESSVIRGACEAAKMRATSGKIAHRYQHSGTTHVLTRPIIYAFTPKKIIKTLWTGGRTACREYLVVFNDKSQVTMSECDTIMPPPV